MSIATADLYDLHGPELASVSVQFRDFGAIATFSGPARTIQCLGGNGLVKATLTTPGRGAVLLVDDGGSRLTALMGDMIAQSAVDSSRAFAPGSPLEVGRSPQWQQLRLLLRC
ncbi:hypothetical protein [Arthrobacter sp. PAMC 25486]|uniref:RraA family protein n=1 Tax=Arthrobacter sp. PAMC 25486 TaxID=1494608 RepID=UPI0009E01112